MSEQKFSEGDLIEVVKGELVHRERAVAHKTNDGRLHLPGLASGPYLDAMEAYGFTVTIIEKAPPKVPSEPGVYLDSYGDLWRIREGENGLRYKDSRSVANDEPTIYAPFTRLEPVSS